MRPVDKEHGAHRRRPCPVCWGAGGWSTTTYDPSDPDRLGVMRCPYCEGRRVVELPDWIRPRA